MKSGFQSLRANQPQAYLLVKVMELGMVIGKSLRTFFPSGSALTLRLKIHLLLVAERTVYPMHTDMMQWRKSTGFGIRTHRFENQLPLYQMCDIVCWMWSLNFFMIKNLGFFIIKMGIIIMHQHKGIHLRDNEGSGPDHHNKTNIVIVTPIFWLPRHIKVMLTLQCSVHTLIKMLTII